MNSQINNNDINEASYSLDYDGSISKSAEAAEAGYIIMDDQGKVVAAGNQTHKVKNPLLIEWWDHSKEQRRKKYTCGCKQMHRLTNLLNRREGM